MCSSWRATLVLFLSVSSIASLPAQATDVSGYQWGTWSAGGSPYRVVGSVTVPKCDPLTTDFDGDGEWDDEEPYVDSNGSGTYNSGETYTDVNGNGHWDPAESFQDLDNDGLWTPQYSLTISSGVEVNLLSTLNVDGQLSSTGATFTDSGDIDVRNGGQANLTDCAMTSSSQRLTYESGSSGTIDNCDGSWSLIIDSANVLVTNGTDANHVDVWASAVLENSTFDYIQLNGGAPTITGNTLSNSTPLIMNDPDRSLSGISGNTYTHANPQIQVSGTLNGTRTFGEVDGLDTYVMYGMTIASGGSLEIDSGITWRLLSTLNVDGQLSSTGATFTDSGDIDVRNGGQANLTDCAMTSSSQRLTYESGSSGTIDNCDGSWSLIIDSANVLVTNGTDANHVDVWASAVLENSTFDYIQLNGGAPTITGNTLSNSTPLIMNDPDRSLSGISGNTYTHANPQIQVSGTLNGTRTFGEVDGLDTYVMYGMTIASGGSLEIDSGITWRLLSTLNVDGQLSSTGATFTDSGDIDVRNGGQANLTGVAFTGGTSYLTFNSGSSGSLQCSTPQVVSIHADASVFVYGNDFSSGSVTVSGSSGQIIDLSGNWWGTTNTSAIDSKIHDCNDNANLPCVEYEPILYGPPQADCVGTAPLGLAGTVYDGATGDRLVSATVSVPGEGTLPTSPNGRFVFEDASPGPATVSVSKAGYYPVNQAVVVSSSSRTSISIVMTPSVGFGVSEVRSRFTGPGNRTYYLDGISLTEQFTATVDWDGHTPDIIRWLTPYGQFDDYVTGTTSTRSFNMGSDFGVDGSLQVIAISGDGTPVESDPKVANMKVTPPPSGLPLGMLTPRLGSNELHYGGAITLQIMETDDAMEEVIPEDMPVFGGQAFKILAAAKFEVEVDGGHGTAYGDFTLGSLPTPWKIAGAEVEWSIGGAQEWHFVENTGWVSGGSVHVGANGSWNVPPHPHYIIFFAGPVPVPVYIRGRFDLGVDATLAIQGWAGEEDPLLNGSMLVNPYAEVMLGVGAADVASVEGYLGGGANLRLQWPQEPLVSDFEIYLAGGVRITLLIFKYEWPLLEYSWDIFGGKRVLVAAGEPTFGIVSRNYLGDLRNAEDYAVFVANDRLRGLRDVVTLEESLQLNVFGQSTPTMVALDNNLMLGWIYDDPVRTSLNRTEIVFSAFDSNGAVWSAPEAVADDGTADFHPFLLAMPNGDALVAWENVSEVLDEPIDPGDPVELLAKMEEMKSKTEISVARYDAVGQTWDTPLAITSNGALDRSPRLAVGTNGVAMLTWVSNAANHEIGSNGAPNTIHFAMLAPQFDGNYDGVVDLLDFEIFEGCLEGPGYAPGSLECNAFDVDGDTDVDLRDFASFAANLGLPTWGAPAIAAQDVPSVVKSAMSLDGQHAVYVFTGDTDDDDQTLEDRELFALTYDGSEWSAVVQVTSNGVEDANPQVEYDASGNLLLVWYSDGNIVAATDLALSDLQTVVNNESQASSGAADFRLATGQTGQLSLVWQDASEDLVDMWLAVYDPVVGIWSKAQRLTTDDSLEYAMTPVYDAGGDLVVAYDKAQTVYESRTVMVGGEEVQVDNVPTIGQVDLYLLRHQISRDLAIGSNGIVIAPPNPMVGTNAIITATVANIGDVAAADLEVAFYDGDPAGDGELIGIGTNGSVLAGGDTAEMSVSWLVPPSDQSHEVHVVVDPDLLQEDRDRTNNAGMLAGIMKPDVVITEIGAQAAGPHLIITVRVANEGAIDITTVGVELYADSSSSGLPIQTLSISNSIAPGAYRDVEWLWENPGLFVGGSTELTAVADSAAIVDEFNEENNTRKAIVDEPGPVPLETLSLDLGGGVTMELLRIPAGWFMMGSDVYHDPHVVTFNEDFYIGRYEVTQAQWQAVMGSNPSTFSGCDDCPVESVSWIDIQSFNATLSTLTGYNIRLPSEAEWEYAARASKTTAYSFGDDPADLDYYGWYALNSGAQTHPVGGKSSNLWGLYDVHGNVWEWCEDTWHGTYTIDAPTDGSAWTTGGDPTKRVLRSGSWYDGAHHLRSDHRDRSDDTKRSHNIGFRIASDP
jgi:hypothetical protein